MGEQQVEARIPEIASDRTIGLAVAAADQLSRLTRPKFFGLENIGDGRALFVGNHTIYGMLDVPFLLAGLWKQRHLALRSLGDHRHWSIPGWAQMAQVLGGVPGTRENAAELMRRGEPILVYPGGAREANKRRGEKYQLFWKDRIGFAKVAIEHEYPVIPFAGVGGEEMLDVLIDDHNPVHRFASRNLRRVTGFPVPSLVRGIGPTPIPRPAQLWFWFGEPIETARFKKQRGDAGARALRDTVKQEVENGIDFLLTQRNDERRRRPRRLALPDLPRLTR